MKILNTLFLSILFVESAVAQNWAPILSAQEVHYKANNAPSSISNTILVDSTHSLANGDSIFYLNRIVQLYPQVQGNHAGYCNQPQFLGKQVTKRTNGTWLLEDPMSFVLVPNALLNEAWTADTLNAITATVTQVRDSIIWGVADSVKVISFSNGTESILSKNHGILSAAAGGNTYNLVGIEGIGGTHLPTQKRDYFDWNVGDEFYYIQRVECCPSFNSGSSSFYYDLNESRSKVQILGKTIVGDTVTYSIRNLKISWHGPSNSSYFWYGSPLVVTNYNSTLNLSEKVNSIGFAYASLGEKPLYNLSLLNITSFSPDCENEQLVSPVTFITDPNGIYHLTTAGASTSVMYQHEDSLLACAPDVHILIEYIQGIGLYKAQHSRFEGFASIELVSCVINGDTLFYPMPSDQQMNLSVEDAIESIHIRTFPNPATTQITVETPIENLSDAKIVLYDLVGREVLSVPVSGVQTTFSVEGLPAGMYFLTVYEKGIAIKTEKVLIARE